MVVTIDDGEVYYLSGPMRGFPEFNYPRFNAIAEHMRAGGKEVRNPAENFPDEVPGSRNYGEYMRLDLAAVLESTAIVLLPGWQQSEGARLEASLARLIGLRFYEAVLLDDSSPENAWTWEIRLMQTPTEIGNDGIEAKARALVYGDRNADYGPPRHDFECIGRKWGATLSAHFNIRIDDVPPEIVSVMMLDVKTSRLGNKPEHLDSRIDTIGYALCLDRIVTGNL